MDLFLAPFGPFYGSFRVLFGPFRDKNGTVCEILDHFWGHFGVILVSHWVDFVIVLTSFWGCFGAVLASLWGRFGVFLILVGGFCAFFFRPNPGHFRGFWSRKKCVETLKPYFGENTQSYRSVKEPGQTDTNSSRYGLLLIENLFRSYLL